MLKIWGRVNSINVMKVLWCADELGLEYERIDAGMEFGLNDQPWYLAMNPNGRVPTIDDDGVVLWESNTIVRYLAARHATGTLYPTDVAERARAERWMDWMLTTPQVDMNYLFWGLVRNAPHAQDPEQRAVHTSNINKLMGLIDEALAGKAYINGEQFSIGDIPIGAMVWRWANLPIERPKLANVEAWFERLKARPAYQKNVMLPLT